MKTEEFKARCENGQDDFSGWDLKGIKLEQLDLSGFKFNGANLNNAELKEVILTKAELQEAKIGYADLRGSNFTQANLNNTQIIKTDLSRAKLTQAKLIKAIITNGSILQNANLSESQLIGANLNNANLTNANLTNANLTQAKALGTNFRSAIFTGACLKELHINNKTIFEKESFEHFFLDHPFNQDRQIYYAHGKDFAFAYHEILIKELIQNYISKINFKAKLEFLENLMQLIHRIEPQADFLLFQALIDKYFKSEKLKYKTKDTISTNNFITWKTNEENNTIILIINEYFKSKNQIYADGKIEINDPIIKALIENNEITIIMQTDKQQGNKKYKAQGGGESQVIAAESIEQHDRSKIEYKKSNSSDRNNEYMQEIVDILKKILLEIEESHDINTTSGRMAIATSAIAKIESDRPLKTKIISAVKSGGIEALKELIDHPAINILTAALEDFRQ